jgi:hypothetical protein
MRSQRRWRSGSPRLLPRPSSIARKPPEGLDAWAASQREHWNLSSLTFDDVALSQSFFQQAIDLDPPSSEVTGASLGPKAQRPTFTGAISPKR